MRAVKQLVLGTLAVALTSLLARPYDAHYRRVWYVGQVYRGPVIPAHRPGLHPRSQERVISRPSVVQPPHSNGHRSSAPVTAPKVPAKPTTPAVPKTPPAGAHRSTRSHSPAPAAVQGAERTFQKGARERGRQVEFDRLILGNGNQVWMSRQVAWQRQFNGLVWREADWVWVNRPVAWQQLFDRLVDGEVAEVEMPDQQLAMQPPPDGELPDDGD